jgi:hypothetical protein
LVGQRPSSAAANGSRASAGSIRDTRPRTCRPLAGGCSSTTRPAFLTGELAADAARLGWDASGLSSCDRDKQVAGLDRAGVFWSLVGNRIVTLAETHFGDRDT